MNIENVGVIVSEGANKLDLNLSNECLTYSVFNVLGTMEAS